MRSQLVASVFLLTPLFATSQQTITPLPAGPFHLGGNRILDSRNRPFLTRGTQLTEFHPRNAADDNRGGRDPHSATSLSAIRLRSNRTPCAFPSTPARARSRDFFTTLACTVRRANSADLLVILAARNAGADFWRRCAAAFKDYPNVMFDLLADTDGSWDAWSARINELTHAVRATGATQPVIAMSWNAARPNAYRNPSTIMTLLPL